MSASAWDRAVEAATLRLSGYTPAQLERWRHTSKGQRYHDMAHAAVAAALPVLLDELADRIEAGTEGDYRAIPHRQSMQRAARIVRGFADEVTQ